MAFGIPRVGFENPVYFGGGGSYYSQQLYGGGIDSIYGCKSIERWDTLEQTRDSYRESKFGRDAVIDSKIKNLISAIEDGSEKMTMKAYKSLLNEMKKQQRYAQLTDGNDDAQLRAVARRLIESKSDKDLEDLIRENMDDAFVKNLKPDIAGTSYCQEDILKEICDIDSREKVTMAKRWLGGGLKYAIPTVAVAALCGFSVPVVALAGIVACGIGAGLSVGNALSLEQKRRNGATG